MLLVQRWNRAFRLCFFPESKVSRRLSRKQFQGYACIRFGLETLFRPRPDMIDLKPIVQRINVRLLMFARPSCVYSSLLLESMLFKQFVVACHSIQDTALAELAPKMPIMTIVAVGFASATVYSPLTPKRLLCRRWRLLKIREAAWLEICEAHPSMSSLSGCALTCAPLQKRSIEPMQCLAHERIRYM